MRYRIVSLLLVVFAWCGAAEGQNPAKPLVADPALTRSMDQVLKDVSSIQAGMSRTDLLRVFTTEVASPRGMNNDMCIGDARTSR